MDTATAATTAAVVGPGISVERTVVDSHGHVESLAPMISELFADAGVGAGDVDVVACGVGPGPFTGLRVGIATAVAMAVAVDRPVVGVCTHDAIARATLVSGEHESRGVMVMTRARRAEVFWSTYDSSGVRIAGPVALSHEEASTRIDASTAWLAGDAVDILAPELPRTRRGAAMPRATDIAAIVDERHRAGEPWPMESDGVVDVDTASSRGESTARALADRVASGRVLLPARPLYLRAPDAVPGVRS